MIIETPIAPYEVDKIVQGICPHCSAKLKLVELSDRRLMVRCGNCDRRHWIRFALPNVVELLEREEVNPKMAHRLSELERACKEKL